MLTEIDFRVSGFDDVGDRTYVDLDLLAFDAEGNEVCAPYIYACLLENADAIGENAVKHFQAHGTLPQGFGDWGRSFPDLPHEFGE